MSCCSVRASCALLIGLEYILSEVVVRCLSVAQHVQIWEWEPQSVPQVHPYGRTLLKSELKWSATWWRLAIFCHCGPVDRWVLSGGIACFSIAMPDHADFLSFVVRISLRANLNDRVVIDGVLIGGRIGPSIRYVVAGCLIAAWNVVAKFLRRRGNSVTPRVSNLHD
jgi:hypothetical protein